ncbi:M23 family metallopeptidase [Actinomadura sp. WMMB 499]|uniref:M23 family metallopeptidase n=1 Tax=Actinomadura sp. WMMB 499 TaxID=1219491 RepID=UPI001246289F|nr:M23 family metallopeptidase [Actinomadura sp. WMMB 499]QFG21501.1 M23 family metallopeptidase [Actinomadura sp. WMMB 499]
MNGKFVTQLSRYQLPLILAGMALTFTESLHGAAWLGLTGMVLVIAGLLVFAAGFLIKPGEPARAPVRLGAPVRGRWVPVNSPSDKVPSHGTHELGQAYAIDLVHQPDEKAAWAALHAWPPMRRPSAFAAFGEPVLAPADGVVVSVGRWQRDHWSRNSWIAFPYLMVEGIARGILSMLTLSSGRFVLGNHVILDLGDGVYGVFAHLKRGTVRVRRGDRVTAGQVLGDCGNSGNSSEPHLHFHLMDRRRPAMASGLPFTFAYESGGAEHEGVPGGRRPFTVSEDLAKVP